MTKHAVVNSSLLGFFSLKLCALISYPRAERFVDRKGRNGLADDYAFLRKYLRLNGVGLVNTLERCIVLFSATESEINESLKKALEYP